MLARGDDQCAGVVEPHSRRARNEQAANVRLRFPVYVAQDRIERAEQRRIECRRFDRPQVEHLKGDAELAG